MCNGTFGNTRACAYLEDILENSPNKNTLTDRITNFQRKIKTVFDSNLAFDLKVDYKNVLIFRFDLFLNDDRFSKLERELSRNVAVTYAKNKFKENEQKF